MVLPIPHPIHSARTAADELAVAALEKAAAVIDGADRFLVTAHSRPDGDALGSVFGLVLGLRALGKDARGVIAGGQPEHLASLLPGGVVETPEALARGCSEPTDVFIVLDTNEPERVGELQPLFYAAGARRICLDHHRTHVHGRHDHEVIVTEAPATGNLVLAFLDVLGVELTLDMAKALWIAIATDTGWFRFANTGPWALQDAARLSGLGVDVEAFYDRIYHNLSPARARLVGHAMREVHSECDGDFIWSYLSLADRSGTELVDLDGVVDYLKTIDGARYIALIVEVEANSFKISLRARGDAEVESIARSFNGGGHAKAAGCRFAGRLEEFVESLKCSVEERRG